jgi:ribokinase
MSSGKPRICVIGSYAVGMTMSCGRFPREGETVMGRGFEMLHGGKGSNQAVAVARLGGAASFMSGVGEDAFGLAALKMLEEEGVDTRFVKRMPDASTGVGFVIVSESGNNEIVIDLGANNRLGAADVDAMAEQIAESDVLLVQLEVNAAAIVRAIDIAHDAGTPVVLNPAPFQKLPDETFSKATYVTPNETEAAAMLGMADAGSLDGKGLAEAIYARFRTNTLVTLGENGVFVRTDTVSERVPAPRVRVVDTTGAGDTFSSALAVALAEGRPILQAARFATWAASMSVEVPGVVPSIPRRSAVEARIQSAT